MADVTRIVRTLATLGAALALALGAAACSVAVDQDEVETRIQDEIGKQVAGVGEASCPGDLPGEVGQTLECDLQVEDDSVDVITTVRSVEGSTVRYDILGGLPRALLAQKVQEIIGPQVTAATGAQVQSTTCDGPLQPRVGETQTCSIAAGGESIPLRTTVTSIDGISINFDIKEA